MRLMREVKPASIVIRDLETEKCFASTSIKPSFAAPSTARCCK